MNKRIMSNGESVRRFCFDGGVYADVSCARREAGGNQEYIVLSNDDGEIWLRDMGDGRLIDESGHKWSTVEDAEYDDNDNYLSGTVIGYCNW